MKKKIMIVDGYNVIHRIPELSKRLSNSLESAREGLISYCKKWRMTRRDISECCVVFDGDSSVLGARSQVARGVRVVCTKTKESADDRILNLIEQGHGAGEYVVVSDDNKVCQGSRRLDAKVISVSEFYGTLTTKRKLEQKIPRDDTKASLSPKEEKEITESLKKEWGID